MTYEIQVCCEIEIMSTHVIPNVANVQTCADAFCFYNECNEILFIAPKCTVVYIKKITT